MVYNLYGKHINSSKVVNNKVTKKCPDLATHYSLAIGRTIFEEVFICFFAKSLKEECP